MTQDQEKFVKEMAGYIQKHIKDYGIEVVSPILAQAILESQWGQSELAKNANNYFGIKYRAGRCPTAIGRYIKIGSEQNKDGSYTSSNMDWCKFANKEGCVVGYLDFINNKNYANLKGVKSPEQYLKNIRADGYATSLKYVDNLMNVIKINNLTQYDNFNMPVAPASKTLYRVQVGAYASKANAEAMLQKLKKAGFDGFIVESAK